MAWSSHGKPVWRYVWVCLSPTDAHAGSRKDFTRCLYRLFLPWSVVIISVKVIHVSTVGFVLFVCFLLWCILIRLSKMILLPTEQSRKKRDFSVCSCYVSDKLTKYPHHKNPPDENSYGLLGLKHYSYYITTLCYPDKLSVLLIVSFNVISLLFE